MPLSIVWLLVESGATSAKSGSSVTCSGAHALTDKLGLIRTYQGFLPGEYALQPIRDTLIVALWLVPYSIKPIYL